MSKDIKMSLVDRKLPDLSSNRFDFLASVLRIASGAVPKVGGLLSELVNVTIPNLKEDRIIIYLECLNKKFERLNNDFLDARLREEEILDLIIQGGVIASRSPKIKIEQIASIVKNGITNEARSGMDYSLILDLISQLDEVQILMLTLKGHAICRGAVYQHFLENHATTLQRPIATMGSSRELIESAAIWDSRRKKLIDLGLFNPEYDLKKLDKKTGQPTVSSVNISMLGRMVLHACDVEFADPMAK